MYIYIDTQHIHMGVCASGRGNDFIILFFLVKEEAMILITSFFGQK